METPPTSFPQAAAQNPDATPLHLCGGSPAPTGIVPGWRAFTAMPTDAQSAFWELVHDGLAAGASEEQQRDLGKAFCTQYLIPQANAVAAIQSCAFLLSQAAALDLSVDLFQQDLSAISEGGLMPAQFMASRYAAVKPMLRNKIVTATLADHGSLLTGISWSVNQVTTSDRGTALHASVVQLTLRYSDGDRPGRLTLQLTPDAIGELKAFTDRFGA